MNLVKLDCVALVLVSILMTISPTSAFTITIEYKPDFNITDPVLANLLSKITNINATAITTSLDKRVIQIDSLLVLNRTIELKNKILVESQGDLLKSLIELAPLVNNLTSSGNTTTITTTNSTTNISDENKLTTKINEIKVISLVSKSGPSSSTNGSSSGVPKLRSQFLPEYENVQTSDFLTTENSMTSAEDLTTISLTEVFTNFLLIIKIKTKVLKLGSRIFIAHLRIKLI